jgi:16S rRNA (uracil1498-N3)-methyltransferase
VSAPVFWAELAGVGAGDSLVLGGAEGHHAASVRRLRTGERLRLTDGAGTSAECVVAEVGRDELGLTVESIRATPPPAPRLLVVQALAKGDRGETAVETLTEVGVDVVIPWAAARCVTQWRDARGGRALEKWRATAREAAKQSRREWWPQVSELASTAQVAALFAGAALGVVLHEEAAEPLAGAAVPRLGDVVVVVGPEGGIDDAELAAFAGAGARALRLGPTVLRTSTAGTAAAAVLLAAAGRWDG